MKLSKEQVKFLLIPVALFCLFFLLLLDAQEYFPVAQQAMRPFSQVVGRFGFTLALVSVHFGIGALLWLYGSRRGVNRWRIYCLTGFCWFWSYSTATIPAWDFDTHFSSQLGGLCLVISVIFLTAFLYLSPRNFFAEYAASPSRFKRWVFWIFGGILICIAFLTFLFYLINAIDPPRLPGILVDFYFIFWLLYPTTCIFRVILLRWEKPQTIHHKLLFWGFTCSAIQTFLYVILPTLLKRWVNSDITTINLSIYTDILFLFFSVSLAYSLLRSQLLLDRSIKNMMLFLTWISSFFSSCVITFFLLAVFQSMGDPFSVQMGVLFCSLLIPLICSWMQMFSRKLLQSPLTEIQRELIEIQTSELRPVLQKSNLGSASLLAQFHDQLWNYQFLSLLFWLDEEDQHFLLAPMTQIHLTKREALLACLLRSGVLKITESTRRIELEVHPQPVWLRHLCHIRKEDDQQYEPLVFPVSSEDRRIALLLLAKRSRDAEPDLDIAELLVSHWSLLLEHLRLSEHLYQHLDVFRSLLQIRHPADTSREDMAQTLAASLAQIFQVSCEIWLGRDATNEVSPFRGGAHSQEALGALIWKDFQHSSSKVASYFHEGNTNSIFSSPFACLPLVHSESEPLGLLLLFYVGPHRFTRAERHLLQILARRVAFLLASASTIERLGQEVLERTRQREEVHVKALSYLSHLEQELLASGNLSALKEELERWQQDVQKPDASFFSTSKVHREALSILQAQFEKEGQNE